MAKAKSLMRLLKHTLRQQRWLLSGQCRTLSTTTTSRQNVTCLGGQCRTLVSSTDTTQRQVATQLKPEHWTDTEGHQISPHFTEAQYMIHREFIRADDTWIDPALEHNISPKLIKNKAYLNGEWVDAKDGSTFAVLDPGKQTVIGLVPDMNSSETRNAIQAARNAFLSWRRVPARQRGDLLTKWKNKILEHHEDLSRLITLESGKALPEARGEVTYGSEFVQFYAEGARRIYGEICPSPDPTKKIFMLQGPVGVSGQITPWNFPASMLLRKAAPALAAGCTVVIKPAEDTPFTALALAHLAEEVGIPPGVINVITASRDNAGRVGKVLCTSPLVANISFTGSTHIGRVLNQQGAGTVKRMSMELGGNGPCMIFNSADIDKAIEGAYIGKFRNGGQACIGINRILVQSGVYDQFLEGFTKRVQKIKIGYGMDEGVTLGPLVNDRNIAKIEHLVQHAMDHGAQLVMGGKRHQELGDNYFLPTIITEATEHMQITHQEIFGPVATIMRFDTEEECVRLANDTNFGLSAYIFSEDHRQIWRVVEEVDAGVIGVNECAVAVAEGTYGGHKESGLGREGGKFGIEEFLEIKYLCYGGF